MGLLRGQEETLIDGDYQVIKTSLFDGMYKSYRFWYEQPIMTVYEMLYMCNMNIDDVEFLVDNGYLIELAQPIVIPDEFRGYNCTFPNLSNFALCKNFVRKYKHHNGNDMFHQMMLSCKLKLRKDVADEYHQYEYKQMNDGNFKSDKFGNLYNWGPGRAENDSGYSGYGYYSATYNRPKYYPTPYTDVF